MASPTSTNFQFLSVHDTLLVSLGALAERYFAEDPITCVMKLRQLGEQLARRVAAHFALPSEGLSQSELLHRLGALPHNAFPRRSASCSTRCARRAMTPSTRSPPPTGRRSIS